MKNIWFWICGLLAAAIICIYQQFWYLTCTLLLFFPLFAALKKEYAAWALYGFLIFVSCLLYSYKVPMHPLLTNNEPQDVEWTGTIISRPRLDSQSCSFVIKPDQSQTNQEKVQVFCYFPAQVEKYQRVMVHGMVRPPDAPGNPGEFDYAAYLSYDRIFYVLTAKSPEDLRVMEKKSGRLTFLESYRQKCLEKIKSNLPAQEAAIMIGMLLGQVEGLDEQEYQGFQKTGIIHVFSVSGMHIAFLALLCSWLLSLMNCPRRGVLLISVLILLLYGTLVDWPTPVIRSVIMAVLGLIALYSGRDKNLLNSLGISGVIILLINPTALFQISFQLSFLAAWGLVHLYPTWRKAFSSNNIIINLILLSLAAQAAIIPLIAYYFHLFTPISLVANLFLGYMCELVVVIGFLFLVVGVFITPIGAGMLELAGFLIEIIRAGNHLLLKIPYSYLWVASPVGALIALYYGGLILASWNRSKCEQWSGRIMITGFFIFLCLPAAWFHHGEMEIVFLDVGQGDCMLLKTPQGEFILIDGGGSVMSDVGSRKVLPYLRYRGITRLLMTINTHPDVDHIAGLQTVLLEVPTRVAAIPASVSNESAYLPFKNLLHEKGVPLIELTEGQCLQEGEWSLKVLYAGAKSEKMPDLNQQSLVVSCQMGTFSALLTGDLGQEVLKKLDEQKKVYPVTVLKLPHHGSKYSLYPPLYQKTKPDYGIISVGARNIFGHPSMAVIKALQEEGIPILRTDISGAILFRSSGKGYQVYTGARQQEL